jgi:hypothetical protein
MVLGMEVFGEEGERERERKNLFEISIRAVSGGQLN